MSTEHFYQYPTELTGLSHENKRINPEVNEIQGPICREKSIYFQNKTNIKPEDRTS